MKWTEQDIEKVRSISIAEQFGMPVGRRVKIHCPMPNHPADRTPSFLVDEDNGYHCFGCGAHGRNFIDFCSELLRQDGYKEEDIFAQIMKEYA